MTRNMSGIILSGGKSLRMGKNKALIEIGGIPMIHRIYNLFSDLFKEIIIVSDQKESFLELNAKIVADLIPNRGALGGLYTGLYFSTYPYSFSVACDMPFLKEPLIEFLIEKIDAEDVIVPKTEDGLQPLHALYSKRCLDPIKKILDSGRNRIIDFYSLVNVRAVEEKEFLALDPLRESFVNVNTPEELIRIRKKTGQEG